MNHTRRVAGFVLWLSGLGMGLGCGIGYGQAIVTTAAGSGSKGFSGDGGPATNASLGAGPGGSILTVGLDSSGNLLIVDGGNQRIRKVANGIITTIAGGGTSLSDGVQATAASIFPNSVASDGNGNIYIGQGASIYKVNPAGAIKLIAGGPFPGYSGDGGPASAATFFCTNIAADAAGNLYLADTTNQRIRKIDTNGIISTIAGTGQQGYSGDGGPATKAQLALPEGVAVDSAGNVYFADNATHVRKVDTSGIITTVAGSGTGISIGDGGPATKAGMTPIWVAVDKSGNLYVVDAGSSRIRLINTSGTISTLAGGALNVGLGNGDGGPASGAVFTSISSVAVDPAGNVYIADPGADRVREVSSGAPVSPVTANPSSLSFSVNAGAAAPPTQTVIIISVGSTLTFTAAASTTSGGDWLSVTPASGNVNTTLTIAVNPSGVPAGTYNGTITITPSGAGNTPLTIPVKLTVNAPASQGIISTVAGNGNIPFSTGGPATSSATGVSGVAVDGSGNLYIADSVSNKVLKVSSSGTIAALAGNGNYGSSGDGGPATSAALFTPIAVAVDNGGNVYIADSVNNRVRKVSPSGTITTVAGTGGTGFSGDGGPAASATVWTPSAVAVDASANLYIADAGNNRVRKVDPTGKISTVAGGAILPGYSGDGGPAVGAGLFLPGGVAVDSAGDLFIADIGNNRVRKVDAAGKISTVAGNGTKGFGGDGGAATGAMLNLSSSHVGLGVDANGNLYIPDTGNQRVRKVDSTGTITTIAGNGIAGFSGDGGPAVSAGLNNPSDVAVDSGGNLYIADATNNRVRKVTVGSGGGVAPSISSNGVVNGASFQPGIVANSWVTIKGTNLAPVTDTWANAIVNGKLPSSLDGVSATVGGQPAYIYYISSSQINLLAPNVASGSTQVTVTSPAGTSSTFTVTASEYGPAFFTWPNNQAVATRQDFSLAVANGTFSGVTTVAAKPGDVIILWGTGFGPTTPGVPSGVEVPSDQTYSTAAMPAVTIDNIPATVYGAALAPGYAGLYQVAIQVPASLADGDWPIVASVGGVSSPAGVVLSVRK